jgi:exopolyphosphatase/guanosine-5'-triphosphate,3'-diphosphate pyrophosphatase
VQLNCKSGKHIAQYEKIVKTADGLAQYGFINDEAISKVILALKEAQKQINFTSDIVKAVTTEAVRRASNSDEVLLQIEKETGVVFEIISGEEEARLTLLAVKDLHYWLSNIDLQNYNTLQIHLYL